MPGLDGTGPRGMGPMTGGGRGWCNPYGPQFAGYGAYCPIYPRRPYPYRTGYGVPIGFGRPRGALAWALWGVGRGGGWGRGRGFRWW